MANQIIDKALAYLGNESKTTSVTPATKSGSYWTSGSINLRKKNGVVMVSISGVTTSGITGRTTVATIPNEFRPAMNTYGQINSSTQYFLVTQSGAIQFNENVTSAYGTTTYITA